MVKLGIKAGGLPDSSAKGQNIGDLGSDVEMEHLQGFGAALFSKIFDRFEEFASRETKLRVIAAGKGPFADSTGGKTDADADEKLDLHRTGGFDSEAELFGLFDHQNHFFAEFSAKKGGSDELGVLVAVADQEAFRIAVVGEAGKEFRLAADFKSEVKGFACVEDLFHNLSHLVDLDWENAAVGAFVAGGFDRFGKSFVDGADAVTKEIVKADEEGIVETAFPGSGGDFDQIDFSSLGIQGANRHVPGGVDAKVAAAPARDSIGLESTIDGPRFGKVSHRMIDIRLQRKNATIPTLFQHLATEEVGGKVRI